MLSRVAQTLTAKVSERLWKYGVLQCIHIIRLLYMHTVPQTRSVSRYIY